MNRPSIPRGRQTFGQHVLLKVRRFWLQEPNVRTVACEPIRHPNAGVLRTYFSAAASDDLAGLPTPTVKGTLFRAKGRPGSGGEKEDRVLRGQLSFDVDSAGAGLKAAIEPSVAYLYEFLYPPAVEESIDVPGFSFLHDYQKVGVQFLANRSEALLADDMGLGKTAQCSIAIAILLKQERISRALVICPRSIILQWKEEALRWGGLRATVIDGPVQARKLAWKYQKGLLLATPGIVNNDSHLLGSRSIDEFEQLINSRQIRISDTSNVEQPSAPGAAKGASFRGDGPEPFDLVVCDDIAMLKNPGQITTVIRNLKRLRSWCMTGTPLENKPEDLLNTFEFVCPGLFGYQERIRAPSKKEIDKRIDPYFLRRRKTDHLLGLPAKMSVGPIVTELAGQQLTAYREAERLEWKAIQDAGMKITKIHIFSVINALIRLCNLHPPSGTSAKCDLLGDELDTILGSGEKNKVVVFSHDLDALKHVGSKLARFNPVFYHGGLSQSQRRDVLLAFEKSTSLLLGSVKACGRGLNLQHASYVFHFDRTWNPIDEIQAEDRCWRQGQTKTVMVYRYLVRGTIEERIHQVLTEKKSLFDLYVDSKSMSPDQIEQELKQKLTLDDFLRMVRPSEV